MVRLFPTMIALVILLAPYLMLQWGWITLSPWLVDILEWLPYLIMLASVGLCVMFYNSREFCLYLTLIASFYLLQSIVWTDKGQTDSALLFNLIALAIPVNFLLFNLFKERGLLNSHGMQKTLILLAELLVGILLVSVKPELLGIVLNHEFFKVPFFINPLISDIVVSVWVLVLLVQLAQYLINPALLKAAWVMSLWSIAIGLILTDDIPVTALYIIIASLILVIAIIIHAYRLAYRDELTQLPSRRALKQQLLSLGKNYSIAMVDVDHFKKLNDNYGHDTGDEILKMLANQLRAVRGGGRPFRYGGEEFTLVFPGMDAAESSIYLNALREKIANTPFMLRHHSKRPRNKPRVQKKRKRAKKINISVSIGVAEKTARDINPSDVIKAADEALYTAKKKGRNKVITA